MTPNLSPNAQSILLLTAPLLAGNGGSSVDLLSPGEYKRLARHLRQIQRQPSDLISTEAVDLLRECHQVVDASRLQRLLGRGFLLSQVIERWQTRAIWVVSRADAEYPRRLKARLREGAPAVLYGCGDIRLLESGGLAIVGSRHVDDSLIDYSASVGRLAARARRPVVSGGAKGIDQAAMRGALEHGGRVSGVLADSLEKTTMNREHRNLLLEGQLVLISPYDPGAGFNVGNAMQRNKLVYALADASLVVSSDLNKGGTWAGAIEQLDKLKFVSVYVRSTGASSAGLDALLKKGAIPWPNPQDVGSFEAVFDVTAPAPVLSSQVGLSLFSVNEPSEVVPAAPVVPKTSTVPQAEDGRSASQDAVPSEQDNPRVPEDPSSVTQGIESKIDEADKSEIIKSSPADMLFSAVREAIPHVLNKPMKDSEVAAALGLTKVQAEAWLRRLVDEGVLEKKKKAAAYTVKEKRLFE
jgi:DNA processing protein